MVDKKITELTELTTPADSDVLAIVDDPPGTPVTKKITFANIESNIDHTAISNIGTNNHSQIDTHLADTTDAHAVSSDTLSFTNKTMDDFSNKIDADEIHIQIRNESGSEMTKGQLVYISGYSIGEDKPLVSLADANGANTFPVLAMINDGTIANNATGHATVSGRVSGIDTNSFNVGDTVYMSTTPGAFSARPTGAGEEVQAIGIVLRKHASLGVLQVFGAGRINQSPNAGHDDFTDFVADEHIDWTADQGATNIHAGNYIDTNTTEHASFSQLDYANAGHTGFAPALGADDNYVTDAEKTVIGNTSGTNTGDQSIPTVDDTAYNATSWDANADAATKNAIRDKVETMDAAISSNTSASHAESHNIASHDTTATGANLTQLTDGSDTTLHDHDGISENTSARHTQNTDTALGSGAVAADHGTPATDEIINVCYGTGSPPTANTTTEGTLFVKYTA